MLEWFTTRVAVNVLAVAVRHIVLCEQEVGEVVGLHLCIKSILGGSSGIAIIPAC